MTLFAAGVLLATGAEPRWLGPLIAGLGAVPLALAALLLAYGRKGKFRVRDRMLAMIAWRGDERVLDVGTGRGLLAIGAAKRTRVGAVGVDAWRSDDPTGNSRARAEANAAADGVAVTFVKVDMRALGFPDASFDVVVRCLLRAAAPERARTFGCARAEIARVLAPGGTVVIGDWRGVAGHVRALAAAGLLVEPPVRAGGFSAGAMRLIRARR